MKNSDLPIKHHKSAQCNNIDSKYKAFYKHCLTFKNCMGIRSRMNSCATRKWLCHAHRLKKSLHTSGYVLFPWCKAYQNTLSENEKKQVVLYQDRQPILPYFLNFNHSLLYNVDFHIISPISLHHLAFHWPLYSFCWYIVAK